MALVTPEIAIGYLKGTDAVRHTDELTVWLAAAESMIHEWLGFPRDDSGDRELDASTYTLYFGGPSHENTRRLDLGIYPVISITSIGDDPDTWDYANNLVDSGDYTLDGVLGRVWLDPDASHTWSSTPRSIRAIVSAGYTTNDKQLTAAVIYQAQHLWQLGVTPGIPNAVDVEQDRDTLMPPLVKQLISRYRIGRGLVY